MARYSWAGRWRLRLGLVYLLVLGNFQFGAADSWFRRDEESQNFCVIAVPKSNEESVDVLCTDIDSDVQGSLALV